MTGEGPIAFEGGHLIDGTGAEPIDGATVVLDGERIMDVGPDGDVEFPGDATRIDLDGRTIMPGLIDAHVHLTLPETQPFYTEWASQSREEQVLKAVHAATRTVEAGFTTVRDVGACGYVDVALRDAVARGELKGPRILATGPGICQTGGHGSYEPPWLELPLGSIAEPADGPTGVRVAIRERLRREVDNVKTFATGGASDAEGKLAVLEFTAEEMEAIYDEAHRADRPVALHCMTARACHRALECGMDGRYGDTLEHGMFLHTDESAIDALVEADVPLIPTFTVYECMAEGADEGLPPASVENARSSREDHTTSFEMAVERDVTIVCGTDTGGPLAYHGSNAQELLEMNQRGLEPMESIRSATGIAADALGVDSITGTLEAGKSADLLVVNGDPLEDLAVLTNADRIELVLADGSPAKGTLRGLTD